MKRGQIVPVAARGDYTGEPRPALVIQSDLFEALDSVTLCLLSSERIDAPLLRVDVEPTADNGLHDPSQVVVDKIVTVPRSRLGAPIGVLDGDTMGRVTRSLALLLGLA